MKSEDNGRSILGASNYAWLKEYMAPIRERVERDRELDDVRTELSRLQAENQQLKQMAANLSRNEKPAAGFFRRSLPQLLGLPSR